MNNDWLESLDTFLRQQLFVVSGTTVNVATLVTFAVVILGTLVVARWTERGTVAMAQRRRVRDAGSVGVVARLLRYLVVATGFAIALDLIGVNLSALFAAGAFLAVAIGFAMQNITQNFVSGIILMAERSIKPGDILELDGRVVRVTNMGIRATIVRTWNEEDLIVPNSSLVQATVLNFTLRDSLYRLRMMVGVAYDSDMREVKRVLTEAATSIDWRNPARDPIVFMKNFGSSSVDWDVSVFMDDPFQRNYGLALLNEAVWFALKDAGITIAFPQLDVHLDAPASVEQVEES